MGVVPQHRLLVASRGVSQPHRAVVPARGQRPPVRTESQRPHPVGVPRQRAQHLARGNVPVLTVPVLSPTANVAPPGANAIDPTALASLTSCRRPHVGTSQRLIIPSCPAV